MVKTFLTLRKNCPNTEFFWSAFSRIWIEYGDLRSKSPYLIQIRENTEQKNSVFGHFSNSVGDKREEQVHMKFLLSQPLEVVCFGSVVI